MRRFVALALVFFAFPSTSASGATCERTTVGPRFVLTEGYGPTGRLVACDRRRAIRRALVTKGPGRELGGFGVAGRDAVWFEQRRAGDERVAEIVRVTLPDGLARRRELGRWRRGWALEGAVAADGTVAYTLPDRRASHVRLIAVGRVVARGRLSAPRFEDGGRTVRWIDQDAEPHRRYLDLRPLPSRAGCPDRERFRRVALLSDVAVSRARYGAVLAAFDVLRVCRVGTDRDVVFAVTSGSATVRVWKLEGPLLVVVRTSASRYGDCVEQVERYRVDNGAFAGREPSTQC